MNSHKTMPRHSSETLAQQAFIDSQRRYKRRIAAGGGWFFLEDFSLPWW